MADLSGAERKQSSEGFITEVAVSWLRSQIIGYLKYKLLTLTHIAGNSHSSAWPRWMAESLLPSRSLNWGEI